MLEKLDIKHRHPRTIKVLGIFLAASTLVCSSTVEAIKAVASLKSDTGHCRPLDQPTLNARTLALRKALALPDRAKDNNTSVAEEAALLRKYNLSTQNADPAREAIKSAQSDDEFIAATSSYTVKHYGFRTTATSGTSPNEVRNEVYTLLSMLEMEPTAFIRAAGVDLIRLNDPLPATRHMGALTNARPESPGPRVIYIGPNNVPTTLNHELGHHILLKNSYRVCDKPTVDELPDFTAANPSGFVYKDPPKNWQGITIDRHAATAVAEDGAQTISAVTTPYPSYDTCKQVEQSPIIARKAAAVMIQLNQIIPQLHLGDYYFDSFTTSCNAQIAS